LKIIDIEAGTQTNGGIMAVFRIELKNVPYKAAIILAIGVFFICIGVTISLITRGTVSFKAAKTPPHIKKVMKGGVENDFSPDKEKEFPAAPK
jgi:hypothetical protein